MLSNADAHKHIYDSHDRRDSNDSDDDDDDDDDDSNGIKMGWRRFFHSSELQSSSVSSVRTSQEFPFTIEPKQLELEVGETKELSVSCFPVAWTSPQLDVYMGLTGFYWVGGFKWCVFPMFLFPFFGGSWAKTQHVLISLLRFLAFFSHQNRPNPTLQISCPAHFFQVKEGTYSDTIVANITDNPEPVEFQLAAIGALPKVNIAMVHMKHD